MRRLSRAGDATVCNVTRMRMLAVAFGPSTMAEALAGLECIREQADCVELRLDYFQESFDLAALLRARASLPGVVTLRPTNQGGRSTLPVDQRLNVLIKAAELGAEYVDLEHDVTTPQALSAIRAAGAQVIVSRHDVEHMPTKLAEEWWPHLADLGADVVKVVGSANDVRDTLEVFRTFNRANRPTIAIAMGEAGLITRVLALRSECCLLTYAALGDGIGGTAPGQLTIKDMRDIYRADRLQSTTRIYGLLGPHVETDRLVEYNAWFSRDGADAVAVPFKVDHHAGEIVEAFRELPVAGWHIHGRELQLDVLTSVDDMSGNAPRVGRVNAIVRRPSDGALLGYWVESPREQYELWLAHS